MTTIQRLRPAAVASLLALALSSAGCLKMESKTTLLKDGSGTVVQTITIDLAKFKQGQELWKMINGGGPGGPRTESEKPGADAPPSAADVRRALESVDGVTVSKAEESLVQTIHLEASFADFSTLGKAPILLAGSSELAKNEDGSWTFTLDPTAGQAAALKGGAGGGAAGGLPPGMDPSMILGFLEQMFGGLEIAQSLVLPGTVTETNGKKGDDGSSVSWRFTIKEILGGKAAMKVSFKGEGIDLKPFKNSPDVGKVMDMFTRPRHKPAGGPKPDGEAPPTTPGTEKKPDGPPPPPEKPAGGDK